MHFEIYAALGAHPAEESSALAQRFVFLAVVIEKPIRNCFCRRIVFLVDLPESH